MAALNICKGRKTRSGHSGKHLGTNLAVVGRGTVFYSTIYIPLLTLQLSRILRAIIPQPKTAFILSNDILVLELHGIESNIHEWVGGDNSIVLIPQYIWHTCS